MLITSGFNSGIFKRWLALTLTGWLAYVLARALWTTIVLGTPFFDWQWYLAWLLFILSLPLWLLFRLRRNRALNLILALLGLWLIFGYNGFGYVRRLTAESHPPVPISFWAFSDFRQTPENVLRDLSDAGSVIYLDVPGRPFEGERGRALADGLRRLNEHDIDVYLAPTASNFLSTPTRQEWIENVWAAAEFVEREGLTNVRGVIGDAEHPLRVPFDILGLERAQVEATTDDLASLLANVPRRYPDLRIGVTTNWPQLVDGMDGDDDLAVTLSSPVDPPDGWAFVNLMTYSSYLPSAWRAYYVYLLETQMAHRYPDAEVSHLIGIVGYGFPWEPLLDFDDLVRDARLSRALGVCEIAVFQLDGALQVFGEDFVRRLIESVNCDSCAPVLVPFSRPASLVVYGIAIVDAVLDLRGWGGVLWIVFSAWLISRQKSEASAKFLPPTKASLLDVIANSTLDER